MTPEKRRPGRRPATEITEPQVRTLKAIRDVLTEKGYPPTIIELAARLGISHASAHAQVGQLVRKGYLRREPNKSRGLAIAREPERGVSALVPVPIIGRVAAGEPLLAVENRVGEVLVEGNRERLRHCFALKVTGDSMVDARIDDGDLVIVRQQPAAESGEIVVALLGDEATVKRFYIRGDQIELRPENRRLRPIRINPEDELRIIGKVVAVRHPASED